MQNDSEKQNAEKYRVISIRTPKAVVQKLDRIRAETNLSRNEIIRQYISYGLDHTTIADEDSE